MGMAPRSEPSKDPIVQPASLLPPRSRSSNCNEKERKRGSDGIDLRLRKSCYFKIRALVHELRPHFIEALKTPDFRNCKAAHEIRQQMKVVMDLSKQMTPETDPLQKFAPECLPPTVESMAGKVPLETKQLEESMTGKKSYIVGGSAFGWNFITFTSRQATVYYGETKESCRSRLKKK